MSNNTIIVSTYRYIWKNKEGKLNVKYLTETDEGHEKFKQAIIADENIVSSMREYVNEVNFSFIGYTDTFKTEVKEDA